MAFLRYTLLRLTVFVATALICYAIGLRGLWWLFVAVFVSGIVSLFLLRGPRDAVSARLSERIDSVNRRIDEAAAAEDAADEERRRREEGDVPPAPQPPASRPPTPDA